MTNQTQPTNQTDVSYEDILNKDILELMGTKNMPEENKKDLYNKMLKTVQNRVILRVSEKLSDEEVAEWQKIAQTAKDEEIDQYLKGRGIDLGQIIVQETLVYKTEMIELAKPIRQAAQTINS